MTNKECFIKKIDELLNDCPDFFGQSEEAEAAVEYFYSLRDGKSTTITENGQRIIFSVHFCIIYLHYRLFLKTDDNNSLLFPRKILTRALTSCISRMKFSLSTNAVIGRVKMLIARN